MGYRWEGFVPVCQMIQNPFPDHRVLDAGDDLHGATAMVAGLDVDSEYPFKALGPGHGGAALGGGLGFGRDSVTAPGRRDLLSQMTVGREEPMEAGQIHAWFGHQSGQPGNEVERLENDVGGAVAVRGFQGVSNIPLWREGQSVGGHGGSGDIPAKALELAPLVGLGGDPRVQGEAGGFGQLTVFTVLFPRGDGLQGECLAAGLGADGDAVGDRMAEQVIHGGVVRGLELQVTVLDIPHQQALALQISPDPLADRLDKPFQCLGPTAGETRAARRG